MRGNRGFAASSSERDQTSISNNILKRAISGQSALHLAIVHDDYETVQLLLQNGADVNARACGAFFIPEDISNYEGPWPHSLRLCVSLGSSELIFSFSFHSPNHTAFKKDISSYC